ncbi:predicted protein [Plenodomus lingam JN3]|uniref:Predicted protein n=1 Tax=Leptosphaeria maculans (strain JN3 / isolate v23.1.3 / race Av1-4-5-6-7-8) TaxID=985895 RepID=E4ZZP0_LEPMJ|nr:predicted protein [Plenodomus lingam JN3]CBX97156.1 predicted protein [Plenodomus lingam JN3]
MLTFSTQPYHCHGSCQLWPRTPHLPVSTTSGHSDTLSCLVHIHRPSFLLPTTSPWCTPRLHLSALRLPKRTAAQHHFLLLLLLPSLLFSSSSKAKRQSRCDELTTQLQSYHHHLAPFCVHPGPCDPESFASQSSHFKAVEQLPGPVAAPSHSESRTMQELAVTEQQGNTQTRQQRFNVRFASSNNYSPTTFAMAPAPKPRSSPPVMPVCPASPVETVESPKSVPEQQPVTTSVEQSKITRNDIRNMTDPAQELSRQSRRSPSVERCLGCNEAWKRPLPDLRRPADMGPTKNGNDLATGNMSIIEQLRAHGRNAEMAHDKWRERHYHCVPRESHEPSSKTEQDDSRSTRSSNSNGTSREARPAQNGSSKRVRDASSEAEQAAKVRKVTSERG